MMESCRCRHRRKTVMYCEGTVTQRREGLRLATPSLVVYRCVGSEPFDMDNLSVPITAMIATSRP